MTRSRRLVAALVIDLVLVLAEAVGGLFAHSTGLVAMAGHDLADAAALGLAIVATRLALRPATTTRSFGYHRATILAGLVNAIAIVVVGIAVTALAAYRIAAPAHVHGGLVVVFALAGLLGNGAAAVVLSERTRDLNVRAAALHFTGDAAGAGAVTVAGAVILATGRLEVLDPIAALVVSLFIGAKAWRLVHASLEVLLESSPPDLDVAALAAAIVGHERRDRGSTTSTAGACRATTGRFRAHVVLDGHPSLEEAQLVGERVKALCRRALQGGSHDLGDGVRTVRPRPRRGLCHRPGLPRGQLSASGRSRSAIGPGCRGADW